jgi:hypothetical protein
LSKIITPLFDLYFNSFFLSSSPSLLPTAEVAVFSMRKLGIASLLALLENGAK